MARPIEGDSFAEKAFYLDEFRGKSLLFALPAEELARVEEVEDVFAELLRNRTRILLLAGTSGAEEGIQRMHHLQERLLGSLPSAGLRTGFASPSALVLRSGQALRLGSGQASLKEVDDYLLWQIWMNLRTSPLCVCLMEASPSAPLVVLAQCLAMRLRVYKLILIDAQGGIVRRLAKIS